MQRVPTGSHRQLDDEWVIDFPEFRSSSSSPRRRVDADPSSADSPRHCLVQIVGGRRDARRSWIKDNWVHAIPLVVLLSLFILWWFSSPVEISIKQGGIAEALRMVIQPNNTADQKVELAILASLALTPVSTTSPCLEHRPSRTSKHQSQMNQPLGILSSDHSLEVSTLLDQMLPNCSD